jgi:transmembrane sensor
MDHNLDRDILEEAARWYARLQAEDCSDSDRSAFERWRGASRARTEAYEAAGLLAESVGRFAAQNDELNALAERAFAMSAEQPSGAMVSRRWMVTGMAAAASVAIAVVTLYVHPDWLPNADAVASYTTRADEQRTVKLDDGSVVHLDVGSSLAVRMTRTERHVDLAAGRALFEVSHDAHRPFSVYAGGARTTALGTQFQVQLREQQVTVTLAQGSVVVDDVVDGRLAREQLAPGQQVTLTAAVGGSWVRGAIDPQIATSWSRGRHVFRDTKLGDAIEEINRYALQKVRLGDSTLASLPVSGDFITGDSELIVSAFAAVLPVRIVRNSSQELVLFKHYEDLEQ